MSLKPEPIQPVPEQTARIARAAFRKGNLPLKLRDELGTIFSDEDFNDLFPKLGQPGLPPWRLALITILQFREKLPDRQAAEAVRRSVSWRSCSPVAKPSACLKRAVGSAPMQPMCWLPSAH